MLSTRERPYVEAALCGGARLLRSCGGNPAEHHSVTDGPRCHPVRQCYFDRGWSQLPWLGVPPEIPNWGNMIASSRLYLGIALLAVFAPGICVAVTVLAVNLLGDGLRDLFDPARNGGVEMLTSNSSRGDAVLDVRNLETHFFAKTASHERSAVSASR